MVFEGLYNFRKSSAKFIAGITLLIPEFNGVTSGVNLSPGSLQLDEWELLHENKKTSYYILCLWV